MWWRDAEGTTERERMPYMQIAVDQWVVTRGALEGTDPDSDRARLNRTLLAVHLASRPAKRRLHGMLDSLEEANCEVTWPSVLVYAAMATREGEGWLCKWEWQERSKCDRVII